MSSLAPVSSSEAMRQVFLPDVMLLFVIRQNHLGFEFVTPDVFGTDKRIKAQYEQDSWQLDPFFNHALASDRPYLGSSSDYPKGKWSELQYYKTFLQPHNLDHELAVYIRDSDKVIGGVSVMRSKGRAPFGARDLEKAQLLVPYLTEFIHSCAMLDIDASCDPIMQQPSERGFVLLDAKLDVVGYNNCGAAYCATLTDAECGCDSGAGHYPPAVPSSIMDDCQELKALFENDLYFACSPRRRVLESEEGRLLESCCTVVPHHGSRQTECCVLISFDECSRPRDVDVGFTKAGARLTKRELHIVQLVAGGYTNQQIASRLCISRYTVENHLKRVFAKSDVRNRTALANRFLLSQGGAGERCQMSEDSGV